MLAVINPGDSLTAVMSGAAATTNPTYLAVYSGAGSGGLNSALGQLSGATAATIIPSDSSDTRTLRSLHIYNGDTAAVVVTIAQVVSGTSRTLAKITLQVDDTLRFDERGLHVIDSSGQSRIIRTGYTTQVGTRAKVGGTAGWVVAAANNLPYMATMAASQTAGTLVIPIDGLHIGDTITAFKVIAQIESAGNTVTLDADLRAVTNVAGEPTDASIGAITQVSATADTAVAASKTGLAEVVTSGKSYYLLVTGTTAASTDIILQHPEIVVTQS